jgi:hypothetical protein
MYVVGMCSYWWSGCAAYRLAPTPLSMYRWSDEDIHHVSCSIYGTPITALCHGWEIVLLNREMKLQQSVVVGRVSPVRCCMHGILHEKIGMLAWKPSAMSRTT